MAPQSCCKSLLNVSLHAASQLTLSTRWEATRLLTDHAANMYAPPALIAAIAADSSAITRACPKT